MLQWPGNDLWPAYSDPNSAGAVFRASILAILESGFCLCAIVTVILNLVIPFEIPNEITPMDDDSTENGATAKFTTTGSGLGKPFLEDETPNTPPAALQMT